MINQDYIAHYNSYFQKVLAKAPVGHYDECALPSYTHKNKIMSWLFWKRIQVALSMIPEVKGKFILDFGCGSGVTFRYLSDNNCDITGCDNQFYDFASDMAKEMNIEAEIYEDIFEIKNKKFDYIVALDVLEHIEDIDIFIDKFADLSHDGTVIIVSGPTESPLYRLGRLLAGFKGHYHKTNIYHIENLFRDKGLKNLSVKKLYFPFVLFRISTWRYYPDMNE